MDFHIYESETGMKNGKLTNPFAPVRIIVGCFPFVYVTFRMESRRTGHRQNPTSCISRDTRFQTCQNQEERPFLTQLAVYMMFWWTKQKTRIEITSGIHQTNTLDRLGAVYLINFGPDPNPPIITHTAQQQYTAVHSSRTSSFIWFGYPCSLTQVKSSYFNARAQ